MAGMSFLMGLMCGATFGVLLMAVIMVGKDD
jgi:hypothetical protein